MRSPDFPPTSPLPAVNIPSPILGLCGLLAVCFLATESLSTVDYRIVLGQFALIPDRYFNGPWDASMLWSPFTYSLLHQNWEHLLFNLMWLVIFGSLVARHMGWRRFLLFYFFCAFGAALVYTLLSWRHVPAIGASGAVFGMVGAATRFLSAGGGFISDAPRPLERILRDRRARAFTAVILGVDLAFALISGWLNGVGIAWQAHCGGFAAGLLLFGWFAPPLRSPSGGPGRREYGAWR